MSSSQPRVSPATRASNRRCSKAGALSSHAASCASSARCARAPLCTSTARGEPPQRACGARSRTCGRQRESESMQRGTPAAPAATRAAPPSVSRRAACAAWPTRRARAAPAAVRRLGRAAVTRHVKTCRAAAAAAPRNRKCSGTAPVLCARDTRRQQLVAVAHVERASSAAVTEPREAARQLYQCSARRRAPGPRAMRKRGPRGGNRRHQRHRVRRRVQRCGRRARMLERRADST